MKKIEVKEEKYDQAKLLLLALAIMVLPVGINLLVSADLGNWFDVAKGLILICVGTMFIILYRVLKTEK